MAHHKSTKKRIKTNEKCRIYNRAIKSKVRTYIRYFNEALEIKKSDDKATVKQTALEKLRIVISELQKATSKGVYKQNTSSRKISRLTKAFNKTFANV